MQTEIEDLFDNKPAAYTEEHFALFAQFKDALNRGAIRSAEPFDVPGTVVLAVDRLDRGTGVGRAIAAMAVLASE